MFSKFLWRLLKYVFGCKAFTLPASTAIVAVALLASVSSCGSQAGGDLGAQVSSLTGSDKKNDEPEPPLHDQQEIERRRKDAAKRQAEKDCNDLHPIFLGVPYLYHSGFLDAVGATGQIAATLDLSPNEQPCTLLTTARPEYVELLKMLLAIYYPELKRLIDRGETTNHNVRRPLPSDTKGMPYVEDGITATIREILTMHYSFAPEDRKEYDLFIAKYASLANLAAEEAESNTFAADYAYVDPKQVRTKVLGLIELLGLSKRNGELARYVEPKVAMRAIDFLFEKCELTEGLLEFGGSCARGFMMPLIDGGLVATQKVRDGKSGKLHAVIDLTAIHPESDLGFIRRASGLTDFSLDLRIGLATTLIALKKEAVAPPEFGASRDIRNDSFVLLSILTSLEYYSVSASAGVNHYQIENGCFFRVGLEKLDLNRCAEALKRLKIFRPWR